MNRKLLDMRYVGLGLLGLLTGCNSGDVNFPDVNVGWPSGSTGTIQFRYTTYDVAEGSVVNISVIRSNGSSGIARVDYTTVDGSAVAGSDYVAASGTLTWPSGTSGNQSISIRIPDDGTAEAEESFSVRLSNPSVAILGTNRTTTVTIADNDTSAASVTGKVSGLNGFVVNGIRYETDSASVYLNELPASVTDVKLGQVVTLHGDVNFSDATGTADEIRYYPSVIGPVESVDVASGKLVVMGQHIRTNTDTVFGTGADPATCDGLAAGTVVEVSGFADTNGTIDATRIDRTAHGETLQLTGRVSALDLANFRFAINGLMLDYRGATLIDLRDGLPANGMAVRAIGTMSGDALVVEQLLAAPLAGSDIAE
ncbi:MAG: DUF5666 domain-containing protein [Woeseiaceae bacterium]|nr:DUF5666 domain-containing protein [Woeseiaceae bacterium]